MVSCFRSLSVSLNRKTLPMDTRTLFPLSRYILHDRFVCILFANLTISGSFAAQLRTFWSLHMADNIIFFSFWSNLHVSMRFINALGSRDCTKMTSHIHWTYSNLRFSLLSIEVTHVIKPSLIFGWKLHL